MYDLATIRENIARHHEANARKAREAADKRGQRRRGVGRRQTAATREKLRKSAKRQHRARQLAEGETSPLRRMRVERELTIPEAARLARVGERTWWRLEKAPHEVVGVLSWERAAAAFRVPVAAILPPDD